MYLVASMSVATGLLLWMEHLVAPPGDVPTLAPHGDPIVEALKTEQPVDPSMWDGIVISYRDRVPGDPAVTLAVPGHRIPYHFVIKADGRIHTLNTWSEQQGDQDQFGSRAVRVCLAGSPEITDISAEQWDALMAMLQKLRVRCQMSDGCVQLDPQSDPQFRPNLSEQAYRLHQMLIAAGVID